MLLGCNPYSYTKIMPLTDFLKCSESSFSSDGRDYTFWHNSLKLTPQPASDHQFAIAIDAL